MGITVIIGGQYGSEGKGKTATYISSIIKPKYAIKVGGTNSGHVSYNEARKRCMLRMLPNSCLGNRHTIGILPAGALIDKSCKESESNKGMQSMIGSTESGTGDALIKRIMRKDDRCLAKNNIDKKWLCSTKELLYDALASDDDIVIEETHGYGLSLYSDCYPYCTSRPISALQFFLDEVELSL